MAPVFKHGSSATTTLPLAMAGQALTSPAGSQIPIDERVASNAHTFRRDHPIAEALHEHRRPPAVEHVQLTVKPVPLALDLGRDVIALDAGSVTLDRGPIGERDAELAYLADAVRSHPLDDRHEVGVRPSKVERGPLAFRARRADADRPAETNLRPFKKRPVRVRDAETKVVVRPLIPLRDRDRHVPLAVEQSGEISPFGGGRHGADLTTEGGG